MMGLKMSFAPKFLLFLAGYGMLTVQAAVFEATQFDDMRKIGRDVVVLNGLGKRMIWWFDAYYAALYLPKKSSDFIDVTKATGSRILELRLLRDAPLSLLEKVLTDGIANNVPPDALPSLQGRMQSLIVMMRQRGSLHEGDVLEFSYTEQATQIYVNKARVGEAIPGKDFHDALLAIWLGPKPIDAGLKADLLGY